jgi:hypothetical protein
MISKKTIIICAVLNLSFATQTIHAGLWQTICSPFKSAATYVQKRPIYAIAAALSAVALSGGIYWWYKMRLPKNTAASQSVQNTIRERSSDAQAKIERDIANFQNTKNLISRYETIDSKIFYDQLNSFLPQVRQALNPDQQATFDALRFGQIPEGSREYWDACAQLYFNLDEYSASAQESLKIMRQAQNHNA